MSSQKGQSSIEKKTRSKKDYSKSNKKITDFFSNPRSGINTNNTDDISLIYGKNEYNINNKEEDKYINIMEDEDDDNANVNYLNNHFYNNSKIKKLKKKMDEYSNLNINNNINHFDKSFKKGLFSPSFFINLNNHSDSDEKRKLILMSLLNDNNINSYKLEINPNDFDNIEDYHKSFPFQIVE